MKTLGRGDILDDFARKCVRRNVRRLSRSLGYTTSDIEDLEQDVLIHLFQKLDMFDPIRGSWQNFVISVVMSKVKNLIQSRCAQKRDFTRTAYSLDELVSDGEGDVLCRHELIEQTHSGALDIAGYSYEQINLKVDVERVSSAMPEELLDVCEMLKYCNHTQTARALDISRRAIYRRTDRIRRVLEHFDMEVYC